MNAGPGTDATDRTDEIVVDLDGSRAGRAALAEDAGVTGEPRRGGSTAGLVRRSTGTAAGTGGARGADVSA